MVERRLFLDPGVLLNLCVVEVAAEILAALPYRAFTTAPASSVVYISESDGETKSYSPEPLVTQGILGIVDLQEQNVRDRFIELACLGLRGTLGELAALASTAEGILATDDQAAIGLITAFLPEVPLLTTCALIHEYAELTNPPRARVAYILAEIRDHAVFTPSERDPIHDWWLSYLDEI